MTKAHVAKDMGVPLLTTLVLLLVVSTLFQTDSVNNRVDISVESASEVGDNFSFLSSGVVLESGGLGDWPFSGQYRFKTSLLRDNESRFDMIIFRRGQTNFSISIYDEGNYSPALWVEPRTVTIGSPSIRKCHEISAIESEVTWRINRDGLWRSEWSTNSPSQVQEFSFYPVVGLTSVPAEFLIRPTSGDSHAYIVCDSPVIVTDGIPISASGRTVVGIHRFGAVEVRAWYHSSARVNLTAPLRILLDSARAIVPVHNGTLGLGGISSSLSGELNFADSLEVDLSYSVVPWEYSSLSLSLTAKNVVLLEGEKRIGADTRYVYSEVIRYPLSFLAVLLYLMAMYVWVKKRAIPLHSKETVTETKESTEEKTNNDKGRKTQKPSKSRKWLGPWIMFLILLSVPIVETYALPLFDKPPAYYYAHYPVQLEVYVEEGINESYIASIVRLFAKEVSLLIGLRLAGDPQIHRLPDDGIQTYYRGEPEIWQPVGGKHSWVFDTVVSGKVTLHVIFHKGGGWDRSSGTPFAGLGAVGRPVSAYPISAQPSSLALLQTMVHEFGHNIGFDHNQCSYVMSDLPSDSRNPVYRYSLTDESDGAGVFLGPLRRDEAPVITGWGDVLLSVFNVTSPTSLPNASRTISNVLYFDSEKGSYHDIWYDRTRNLTSGETSEWLTVRSLNPQGFQLGWSGEEALYVSRARTSDPIAVPGVPTGCRSPYP